VRAYDVVVVGGRVAGASTALLLARAGARVAVVERGGVGHDTVSTHALMRAGVLQLSRWGVLDRIVAAGTPPVQHTVFDYPDGKRVQVSIRGSHGVEALYAPRRTLLDPLLLELAVDAGVEVHRGSDVVAVTRGPGGRVTGVATTGPSGDAELSADLVVGADGLRSTVAREVAAPTVRRGRTASALLYRYVRGLDVSGYEWHYGDRAAAGLIPTNDDATCVFASTTPARLRRLRRGAGPEAAFHDLLEAATPGLGELVGTATDVSRMRGWRGAAGHVRQSWGPGWALVGDAGYYKDPITAHGITDALRDAELLSRAIERATAGGPDARHAMAAYQETRDRLSRSMWDATEEVAGYAWDAPRARTLLRTVSASMSDEVDHLSALPHHREAVLGSLAPDGTDQTSVA
jgi:2-polyprenyl-6-methoxyphenol hydroxylase-like FAD-dependent oxidoreductase